MLQINPRSIPRSLPLQREFHHIPDFNNRLMRSVQNASNIEVHPVAFYGEISQVIRNKSEKARRSVQEYIKCQHIEEFALKKFSHWQKEITEKIHSYLV